MYRGVHDDTDYIYRQELQGRISELCRVTVSLVMNYLHTYSYAVTQRWRNDSHPKRRERTDCDGVTTKLGIAEGATR